MAIDPGAQTLVLASLERTWRVNIEATKGTDRVVAVFREGIKTAPDGSVVSQEITPSTSRDLSAVAAQSDTVAGKTCTTAEIAALSPSSPMFGVQKILRPRPHRPRNVAARL
jgi:hypothetical protein